jgi:hypothetical protein
MTEPTKIIAFKLRGAGARMGFVRSGDQSFPRFRREWDRPMPPLAPTPLAPVPLGK